MPLKNIQSIFQVSKRINALKDYVMGVLTEPASWERLEWLVRAVLSRCIPSLLLDHCGGVQQCLERVPRPYVVAMVAAWLAKTFVYRNFGEESSEFAFYEFMRDLEGKANINPLSGQNSGFGMEATHSLSN